MAGTQGDAAGSSATIGNDQALEEAAVRAVAVWVRRYGFDRRTFEKSVRRVVVDSYEYARVLFVYERRLVFLHTRPANGETSLAPIPNPELLDPWDGDHEGLEQATRVAAKCPRCVDGNRGRCSVCDGTRAAPCRGCEGEGRVAGARGLKNCPDCRGAGTTRCKDCTGAGLVCTLCEGSAQLVVWLEIHRDARSEVAVGQPAMFMEPHTTVAFAEDFDAGRWPNPLREDTGLLLADEVEVPADLVPRPRADERLVGARVQRFGRKAHTIEVDTAFGVARIRTEGEVPAVNALRSDFSPFYGRLFALGAAAFLGLVLPRLLEFLYERRNAFFADYGYGPTVFWLGILLGAAALTAVAVGTLAPKARPKYLFPSATASGALFAALTVVAFIATRPSKAHAIEALRHGEVKEAQVEAYALRVWSKDLAGAAEVDDELYLADAAGSKSAASLSEIARREWRSAAKRESVVARLREAAKGEAHAAEARASARELEALAMACDGFSNDDARTYYARAAIVAADKCAGLGDVPCVVTNAARARKLGAAPAEVDALEGKGRQFVASTLAQTWGPASNARGSLETRASAIASALRASSQWEALHGGQSSPSKAQLQAMDATITRLAEEASAKAGREQAARDAAEEARERATRVRCQDGTYSPSCRCGGGGGLRGCCSWHGGVAGCGG